MGALTTSEHKGHTLMEWRDLRNLIVQFSFEFGCRAATMDGPLLVCAGSPSVVVLLAQLSHRFAFAQMSGRFASI